MIADRGVSLLRNMLVSTQHQLLPGHKTTRGEKRAISLRLLPHPCNLPSNLLGLSVKVLAGIFLGLAVFGVARADDKPKAPEFVPIVVDQAQYSAALAYLGGLKFNDAAPMVRWLNELEDRAKGQWEADHALKPEAEK